MLRGLKGGCVVDTLDFAQEIEQQNRDFALKQATLNREKAHIVEGEVLCLDCDDAIPKKRVESVNAVRCIDCQMLQEIKLKQGV